jgi:WD40 repeat protein
MIGHSRIESSLGRDRDRLGIASLTRWEREGRRPGICQSHVHPSSPALRLSPLPAGEGRGEGEFVRNRTASDSLRPEQDRGRPRPQQPRGSLGARPFQTLKSIGRAADGDVRGPVLLALFLGCFAVHLPAAETPDYAAVHALWEKHCLDCHNATDAEKGLNLESFEALMKGGESGSSLVPGNSRESLLVKFLEGRSGKTGKNQFMPPGRADKLTADEIAVVRAWIDAGAKPPAEGMPLVRELKVPQIEPRVAPRRSIKALAHASKTGLMAVARYGEVELRAAADGTLVRTLTGMRGSVNAVVFTADGRHVFAAGGLAGVFGEVRQWNTASGEAVRTIEGHRDSIYALALSPDGATLATGSYDQKVILWNAATGEAIRTLDGHNGCIHDLAFRPDGRILASASADRTVKLWHVATGERRDTFTQPLKELHALAFSPDGSRLAAGGVDNRIRVWTVSREAKETTNPLLYSRFGHEGAILRLVFSSDGRTLLSSADDRTVKLWDAHEMRERLLLERQSDWAPALALVDNDKALAVGRMDGSLAVYDVATGKAALQLDGAKPVASAK